MKPTKRTIILAAIVLVAGGFLAIRPLIPVEDALVRAKATPRKIHVGDNIRYTITVKAPEGAEVKFPDTTGGELGDFKIKLEAVATKNMFANKEIERTFDITIYRTGTYRIPSLTVYYRLKGAYSWRSIGVPAFLIEVKPLVTVDLEAERRIKVGGGDGLAGEMKGYGSSGIPGSGGGFRGSSGGGGGRFLKAPIRYFINEVRPHRDALTYKDMAFRGVLLLVGVGVFIVVVIIVGGVILYKREPAPPIPHKIALRALRSLKGEKLGDREFYVRLSAILKEYLRARFGMKPAELPIEDFTGEVSALKELADDDKKYVIERLRMYEVYKYSEVSAGKTDMDLALKAEEDFVNKTAEEEEDDV